MIQVRKSIDRGHADHGWLDTHHTFSFAHYQDPAHMGFRALRVLNEDRVQPGAGFGNHGHRDMEIVSYVLGGNLAHKDNMGNGSVLVPGDVQRMTAGTGVQHSERNPSLTDPLHFLQIWILPERDGLTPGYEEANFSDDAKRDGLRLLASQTPRDGALKIHQDVDLYATILDDGGEARHDLRPGRHAWVQVIRGGVTANGTDLAAGDGAAITAEDAVNLVGRSETELLLFDLA